MARILTFLYPDCGFEISVPMEREQSKSALVKILGPVISKKHRKKCLVCKQRRQERFRGQSSGTYPVFSTAADRDMELEP